MSGRLGIDQITQRAAGAHRVKGVAGDQGEAAGRRIEQISILLTCVRDPGVDDAIAALTAVRCLKQQPIARCDVLEEAKMGIAVPADDDAAGHARRGGAFEPARGESEHVTGTAVEHDLIDVVRRDLETGDGPGVRPSPGPGLGFSFQCLNPGTFQQHLGQGGLGVDVNTLAKLEQTRGH